MAATEGNTEKGNAKVSRWDKKLVRSALFAGTLIVALVFTDILWLIRGGPSYLLLGIMFFWAFPFGLINLIQDFGISYDTIRPMIEPLWAIGWVIYLTISVAGTVIPSRRVFKAFYVVFVILLLVNVGGCSLTTLPVG